MSSLLGDTQGKSRSASQQGRFVEPYIRDYVQQGFQPVQNETFRQIAEALRTGGVGAQIPIIQQAVSQSREAYSQGLRDTEAQLGQSGLGRTPYGQSILANARQTGLGQIARIPTDYASQIIQQAPAFTQGILGQILSALAGQSTSKTRSGPYST